MINRLNGAYSIIDNAVLDNQELSLKAKGLYAFLCSKPENWSFSYDGLTHQLKEGEKAIRGAVKELVEAGYLIRHAKKAEGSNNFDGYEWIVNPTEEDRNSYCDPFQIGHAQNGYSQEGHSQNGKGISNTRKVTLKSNTEKCVNNYSGNIDSGEFSGHLPTRTTVGDNVSSVLDVWDYESGQVTRQNEDNTKAISMALKSYTVKQVLMAIKSFWSVAKDKPLFDAYDDSRHSVYAFIGSTAFKRLANGSTAESLLLYDKKTNSKPSNALQGDNIDYSIDQWINP